MSIFAHKHVTSILCAQHNISKDKGMELQSEQDCVTGVKNLLCSKNQNLHPAHEHFCRWHICNYFFLFSSVYIDCIHYTKGG